MNPFVDEAALSTRVNKKLRYRYARWLATHKPDRLCYRPAWRNFWRKSRRVVYSAWKLIQRARLDLLVTYVALAMGVVTAVAMIGGLGTMIALLTPGMLQGVPADWPELQPEAIAEVSFGRLTLFQYWLAFAAIALGFTYRRPQDSKPTPGFFRRDRSRRQQIIGLRVVFGFATAWALAGAILCPTNLPFYWRSLFATGIGGVALATCSFWLGMWLARFHLPNYREWGQIGMMLAGFVVTAVTLTLAIHPIFVYVTQELAWLGPIGWLNAQAMEFGRGSVAAGWLWSFGVVLVGLITFQLRRQTLRSRHWRSVLTTEVEVLPPEGTNAISKKATRDELAQRLRENLEAYPTKWHRWFVPRWLLREWVPVAIAAVLTWVVQGVAIGFHWWFEQIQADGQMGVGEPLLFPFDEVIALGAMGLMMWSIEMMGILVDDQKQLFEVQQRPISAAELWRAVQWRGFIRTPAILLGVIPFTIVPLYLMWDRPWVPFLMIGVTFSSMFATRTGIVASALVIVGVTLLPAWLLPLAIIYIYVPAGIVIYGVYSSMPDFAPSGLSLPFRQVSAHLLAILLMAIGCAMWHWYGKLPPESVKHSAD